MFEPEEAAGRKASSDSWIRFKKCVFVSKFQLLRMVKTARSFNFG